MRTSPGAALTGTAGRMSPARGVVRVPVNLLFRMGMA